MNSVAARASGGIQLLIGSGSGDYKQWYVGGSDTEVFGLWNPYPVNPTVAQDATTGTPGATLQYFGGQASLPTGGPTKGSPWAIDAMRYGRCRIDATAGEAANYATLAGCEATANSSTNRWGLLQEIKGTYLFQGFLQMGTVSTAVDWRDSDRVINILDTLKVTSAFNRFEVVNASSNVEWTNYQIRSLGTTSRGTLVVTAGTFTAKRCQFTGMNTFTFLSTSECSNSIFTGCNAITAPGTDMTGSFVLTPTVAADASALVWNVATDPDGYLDDMTFSKGTNAHHAIEFGTSSPTSITLRGMTTSGFNASNAQNDSTFYVARTSGTVTINIVGGTGNFSYKSAGATVNIVIDPVTTLINVRDENDSDLQNARVLVEAADGTGDLPYEESVTITRSGSTATVAHTAHGLVTNDKVVVRGADQQEYNGVFQITVTGVNAYTYAVTGTPATPATGTITSTGAVLEGLTDVNGEIQATRSFTVDQPVLGRVRKSTGSPLYKAVRFTDTVDNVNGLTKVVQMVRDD
jgi:hypothetical protein